MWSINYDNHPGHNTPRTVSDGVSIWVKVEMDSCGIEYETSLCDVLIRYDNKVKDKSSNTPPSKSGSRVSDILSIISPNAKGIDVV